MRANGEKDQPKKKGRFFFGFEVNSWTLGGETKRGAVGLTKESQGKR